MTGISAEMVDNHISGKNVMNADAIIKYADNVYDPSAVFTEIEEAAAKAGITLC